MFCLFLNDSRGGFESQYNNCEPLHLQEEMARLQQSIENLKLEFGDEADDQKVI